jgi:F-type H+-transporting ATPase subunit epsilon
MVDLQCVVASPEKLVFKGKVRSVVVPATDGELGILRRHAPLLGALSFGELRIEDDTGRKAHFFVQGGGFVEVVPGQVTVLATEIETLDSIDPAEAEERVSRLRENAPRTSDFQVRESHAQEVRAAERRLELAKR